MKRHLLLSIAGLKRVVCLLFVSTGILEVNVRYGSHRAGFPISLEPKKVELCWLMRPGDAVCALVLSAQLYFILSIVFVNAGHSNDFFDWPVKMMVQLQGQLRGWR